MPNKKEEQIRRATNRVKGDTYVVSNKITADKTVDGVHATIFGGRK